MRKYELDEKTFEWLSIKPDSGVHRFAVQSIGGFKKYDCFSSLDDAFQYILENVREDVMFLQDCEIYDMRSGITWMNTNLKQVYRTVLSSKEK